MTKTKVDDMLMEMISPKVSEIEARFSNGEGLSQDDINTLLLKSQYNHINHLDQKLDEVTSSVIELESKFDLLKTDLEGKFDLLRSEIQTTIQAALNKNMMLLITVMGVFLILSKIIDKF